MPWQQCGFYWALRRWLYESQTDGSPPRHKAINKGTKRAGAGACIESSPAPSRGTGCIPPKPSKRPSIVRPPLTRHRSGFTAKDRPFLFMDRSMSSHDSVDGNMYCISSGNEFVE